MLGTNRRVDHAFRSALLLGALLVSATGTRAAEVGPPARGVELAFRTGVLIPGGDAQIYTFPDPPEGGPDSMTNSDLSSRSRSRSSRVSVPTRRSRRFTTGSASV